MTAEPLTITDRDGIAWYVERVKLDDLLDWRGRHGLEPFAGGNGQWQGRWVPMVYYRRASERP